MTGTAGAGIIPGWQHSPAARPVRWTAIAQALVRDRIPLQVGTLPREGGGLCTALCRRGGALCDQGEHAVPDLTLGSRGAAVRMGARIVTLVLSGAFFLLERCKPGLRQRWLLNKAWGKKKVGGGGDMFVSRTLRSTCLLQCWRSGSCLPPLAWG